ncbi:multivesicular body subunit 12B [Nematostella vectensis]|uniref:multivesicular body subunit 12B n=1 Tax=Nematostella vectensis TaxID=45351 RepID=UPI002076E4C6|nr:multivesicular body subunit 12B [Nematostella vectensis]
MQSTPDPVTDVKVVSQKEKCPPGYFCLEKTVLGHDGQLYDSTWRSKGKRYICYSKKPGSHVIVGMSIIHDGDPVPQGFTAVTTTHDDNEKAFRKHQLCLQLMPKDQAQSVVIDLALVNKSKAETPPPAYYTITNDVNDLNLCFRMGPLPRYQPPQPTGYPGQFSYSSVPHPVGPNRQQWSNQEPVLNMPVPWQQQQRPGNMPAHYTPQHAMPAAKPTAQTGIEGVPFQINSKFDLLWKKAANTPTGVPTMSSADIQSKFSYDFSTERAVLPS